MTFDPSQSGVDDDAVASVVEETIAENEVALFMKGTPMMPQCGYSKRALGLVTQYRDDVETVDALQNLDAFRAELEERSGWETIPQTYVDGEFVGGSDVLAELEERGELADTLNADPAAAEADADGSDGGDAGDAGDDELDAPF